MCMCGTKNNVQLISQGVDSETRYSPYILYRNMKE